MKLHTKWKRVYHPIIGQRLFDAGEYSLGYFTIEKLWKCKEYCKCATALNGTHWFDKTIMQVRTDVGLVYKMPFCPWYKMSLSNGKSLSDFFDEHPYMTSKKPNSIYLYLTGSKKMDKDENLIL